MRPVGGGVGVGVLAWSLLARCFSAHRTLVTMIGSAALHSANGTRGSTFRNSTVSGGLMAPATPMPSSTHEVIHGTAGAGTYLPSSAICGARKAEEVSAHKVTTARNNNVKPNAADNGSSKKAVHETAVKPTISGPRRPALRATRSAFKPIAKSIAAKIN